MSKLDVKLIAFFNRISDPFGRCAIFVVFFWFGLLKVIGASPANPLVENLLQHTLPFVTFNHFIILFGIFEMLIGILFLWKSVTRFVIPLLCIHMLTTLMPLLLLPQITWQSFMIPTLEGQYIIKNLVIVALAIGLVSHLHPIEENNQ